MKILLLIMLFISSNVWGITIAISNPYVSRANSYKGQLHFHTDGSGDGNEPAEDMAVAYRDADSFDFLAVSDHDSVGATDPSVSGILWIISIEESDTEGHFNAIGAIEDKANTTPPTMIGSHIADGAIIQINHPIQNNPPDQWTEAEIDAVIDDVILMEIWNERQQNDAQTPTENSEVPWDVQLTKGNLVYGTAVDDSHDCCEPLAGTVNSSETTVTCVSGCDFSGLTEGVSWVGNTANGFRRVDTIAGNTSLTVYGTAYDVAFSGVVLDMIKEANGFADAWVVVHADSKTENNIITGLSTGNFYASTGADITITVSDNVITATTTTNVGNNLIEFIKKDGATAATFTDDGDGIVTYTVVGQEEYIRIKVTDDNGGTELYAWSQPLFISVVPIISTSGLTTTGVIISQ